MTGLSNLVRQIVDVWRHSQNIEALRKRCPHARIESGAVILGVYSKIKIGEGTLIESGSILDMQHGGSVSIGKDCAVRRGAISSPYGGDIRIGDGCGVQHYTILYGHGGLQIGDYVRSAAQSMVIPANHGIKSRDLPIYKQPLTKDGIVIGNNIWVGAGVTITDGVQIADGAVIASGSVRNSQCRREFNCSGCTSQAS